MGIYEILFRFQAASNRYMGDPGTHPWAQGFPMTTSVPGGPEMPSSVAITADDRMYPKADGQPELREAIAHYYREFYGSNITADNVAVFAGGRPALFAILALLKPEMRVAIEETEYTPYYDLLKMMDKAPIIVPSNRENSFRPKPADYPTEDGVMLIKSNPCNPTGVTLSGSALKDLVDAWSGSERGALIDEAYEFFGDPEPVSALAHIDDIDATNLFIVGAATKGLQCPGMRTGWVVASKEHIELFRNYSSFAMGGVSRASQLYVTELLETERVRAARAAVAAYYTSQRKRYGDLLASLGIILHSGDGGFYHWCELPEGMTGDALNEKLFQHDAGILPGRLCDMHRRGDEGPHGRMFRFSFGPLGPEAFEGDAAILREVLPA